MTTGQPDPAQHYPRSAAGPRAYSPWRMIGVGLFGLTLILVVIGSFLPLLTTQMLQNGQVQFTARITSWELSAEPQNAASGSLTEAATFGVPLVIAAVILLAAALLSLAAARSIATRSAVLVGAVAAAFLTGIVWAIATQESANSKWFTELGEGLRSPNIRLETSTGAGYWLLIAATVLSVGAAVATAIGAANSVTAVGPVSPTQTQPAPPHRLRFPRRPNRSRHPKREQNRGHSPLNDH